MSTTARRCIFCGAPAGSGEHGFPDWLNSVFPHDEVGPSWVHFGQITATDTQHRSWQSTRIASQRIKSLCRDCNTGWMSQLEGAAKPVLLPMITGHPTMLTQTDQLLAATWAVKTVMVLEQVEPTQAVFRPEDRQIVLDQRRPPAHVLVVAAAIEGEGGPLHFAYAHGKIGSPQLGFVADVHYYTLQVGALVLQVVRPEPAELGKDIFKTVPEPAGQEVGLYPPVASFYWPPAQVQSIHTFRSYSLREGWMRVVGPLNATRINDALRQDLAS